VAHLYAAGSYYSGKDVLFIAAIPPRGQSPGRIIPLRWGKVQSARCDAVDKRQSVTAKVIVGRYAVDFAPRFIGEDKSTAWDRLAKYVGEANLPFGSSQGYFSQFVGLELGDACVNESDCGGGLEKAVSFSTLMAGREVRAVVVLLRVVSFERLVSFLSFKATHL